MSTSTTITSRPRAAGHYRLFAVILGVCALAVPASASAFYGSAPDEGTDSAKGSSDSGQLVIPDHTALNASLNRAVTPERSSPNPPSGYTSLNAVTGGHSPTPTFVSSSPVAGDGFDWADAALGAGATMALVAFGAAALVTIRRHSTVSPSTSS